MSSLLDNIENTLQYGDIEMLRKEFDEKIGRLESLLNCKSDINYIEQLQRQIYELECKNKEIFAEFKRVYEKISSFTVVVRELVDVEHNTPVERINERYKYLLQSCDDFTKNFYECSKIALYKSY